MKKQNYGKPIYIQIGDTFIRPVFTNKKTGELGNVHYGQFRISDLLTDKIDGVVWDIVLDDVIMATECNVEDAVSVGLKLEDKNQQEKRLRGVDVPYRITNEP